MPKQKDKKLYNHDYDAILTRLTTILSRLNDGEALSVTELSEEFGVSPRTIQRDFNERLTKFPIYQDGKRWKMSDGNRIEKTTSLEDALVLDIVEELAVASGGTFGTKAKSLIAKLKNPTQNSIYTKLDIEDISDKLNDLQTIESAIQEKKLLNCTYSQKLRVLKPLKIVNFAGSWYLLAIDTNDDKLKKFYIKDIKNLSKKDEVFSTDDKLDSLLENSVSIWFDETKEPYKVTLLAEKEVAKYFERKPISKTQKIEQRFSDNSLELSLMITHPMEIIPVVMNWLPHVEILEPESLRDETLNTIEEYLQKAKSSCEAIA